MKEKFKRLKRTLLTGILVLLPIIIITIFFNWLYKILSRGLEPFTNLIWEEAGIKADFIIVFVILIIALGLGFIVKTSAGKLLHSKFESKILIQIPGYSLVKNTINQFLGHEKKYVYKYVALVNIYENSTLVTGFVTDESNNGTTTVFVPTSPNPTSGQIFHVQKKYIHKLNASIEDTMRSVISLGHGSSVLINNMKQNPK